MLSTETRESLLRSILEDPTDDLLRLIYADFLEEYGDENSRYTAGFIRTGIELAKIGEPDFLVEEPDFRLTGWTFPDFKDSRQIFFSRGFVHTVSLTRRDFLSAGMADYLFSNHPIEHVLLTDTDPEFTAYSGDTEPAWFRIRWDTVVLQLGVDSDDIPEPIWRLIDKAPRPDPTSNIKSFGTTEEAYSALDRACVAYGRQKVGLPPLKYK